MNVNTGSIAIDVVVIISSGIILQVIHMLCRKKGYPLIAANLFGLKQDKLVFHFSKQMWKFTWHVFCVLLELIVLIPSDFWGSVINPYNAEYGTSLFWTNMEQTNLPSTGIRLLYLFQIGYYLADLLYMVLWDRPNDLRTMCFHHIASLSLLWMSYLPKNGWKIGCAILLYHEIGDFSLTFTKTLHYAQFETVSNVLFVVHILIWIWSRLIWFPRVIASLFIDITHTTVWQVIPCGILLCSLLILHVFWTFLMLKVLYKAVTSGEKMADKRDREVSTATQDQNSEESKQDIKDTKDTIGDIESKLESIEMERTNAIANGNNSNPPLKRRRSSLVEAFIETQEKVVINDGDL